MLWHFLFESLAYIVALRIYLRERESSGDFLQTPMRWSIIVAAICGAAIGSKILYWFEDPARTLHEWTNLTYIMGGKTVVGALLGGTMAVEWAKSRMGLKERTGDLFAIPIAVGIAVGRLGCFFAGTQDNTYGLATTLPWGVNLGDGVQRHPVQIYESVAMLALAAALRAISPQRFQRGDRFRAFLAFYLAWRIAIDFLKPGVQFGGLTILQWCSVAGLLFYMKDVVRMLRWPPASKELVANG